MEERDDNRFQDFFSLFLFLCVIGMLIYITYTFIEMRNIPKQQKPTNKNVIISDTFSEAALKNEIKMNNIKFPEIVYAQARLETGNFTSNYFKKRNNLFGFRNRKGYMFFKSWKDCVKFYADWQNKYYGGGDYYDFLILINYAEDKNYINKLKLCIK